MYKKGPFFPKKNRAERKKNSPKLCFFPLSLSTIHTIHIKQAAILYNLKKRHLAEKPYTRTGDIVIAVNPYQWIDGMYSEKKRLYYSNRLVWERTENDPRTTMEPHVYEVSALSYKGLSLDGEDQSILVSVAIF